MNGLYRGKTKDGKVVYGYYVEIREAKKEDSHWIIAKYLYRTDIMLGIDADYPKSLQGCYEILPESLAQKTGVKDKNKKDIYGSIEIEGKMTVGGDKCNAGNLDFTVEWLEGHLCWVARFGDTQYSPLYMVRGNAENLEIIPQEAE